VFGSASPFGSIAYIIRVQGNRLAKHLTTSKSLQFIPFAWSLEHPKPEIYNAQLTTSNGTY